MITKITDEVIDRLIEGDVLIYSDIYTIEDGFIEFDETFYHKEFDDYDNEGSKDYIYAFETEDESDLIEYLNGLLRKRKQATLEWEKKWKKVLKD